MDSYWKTTFLCDNEKDTDQKLSPEHWFKRGGRDEKKTMNYLTYIKVIANSHNSIFLRI